jgi:hypothetical protein
MVRVTASPGFKAVIPHFCEKQNENSNDVARLDPADLREGELKMWSSDATDDTAKAERR